MPFNHIVAPYILYVLVSGALLYGGTQVLSRVFSLPPRTKMLLYAGVLIIPIMTYTYYLRHMSTGCDMLANPDAIRICSLAYRYSDILTPLTLVFLVVYVVWRVGLLLKSPARRSRVSTDSTLATRVHTILHEWGYKGKLGVSIIESQYPTAFVRGVFRPEIVISRGMLALLPDDALRAVLAHEVAHIEGGDNVYNLVLLLRDISFFSPFAHLAYQAYSEERELAADLAASKRSDKLDLAAALLKVAKRGQELYRFAWQHSYLIGGTPVSLRVNSLLREGQVYSSLPPWLALSMLATLVLALC